MTVNFRIRDHFKIFLHYHLLYIYQFLKRFRINVFKMNVDLDSLIFVEKESLLSTRNFRLKNLQEQ